MNTSSKISEKELLSAIAGGDERAFAELFDKWSPFLSGYVFQLTESKEVTREIVQDVFMKIWTHRQTLPEINNFKAFLFIVSRNQAYHALRSLMREQKRMETYKQQHLQPPSDPTAAEYYSILDEAIDQLPARRKEVYLLSRHQRMTYDQIGRQLGINRESVKTHLSLATSSIINYVKTKFPELTTIATLFLKNFF